MKYQLDDTIKLIVDEFADMKKIYDEQETLYNDISCVFYLCEFSPYVLAKLQQNNESELKKIFGFIESLFINGDESVVNMIICQVIEDLYDGGVCSNHSSILRKFCGKHTLQSFVDCFDDEEKVKWDKSKAA